MKKVIEVGSDLILLQEAYEDQLNKIKNHITTNGPSTVSALRQDLGVSRRIAIPLLEKLDREGYTTREGDLRKWNSK
ncbi:MAG: hypothetical protein HOH33_13130 [Verrucomicrobia bacterium]|nr:hypothetical protein [Verrucomicrobiota bacterium]